jgi:gliding motility-associated-like protein
MPLRFLLFLVLTACSSLVFGQTNSCGQQEVMKEFYHKQPAYKQLNEQVEQLLYERNQKIKSGELIPKAITGVVTLPVVVHIIHNNGSENISDAQVLTGIQHLNEAFANTGFYDPTDGVNTQIQFCMAQRDPNNNATNGITRDVSAYTVMGGPTYYSDDLNVKNINRWNPNCYINIWLVRSIPGSVAGYAYLPAAHGSNVDGIIEEAAYFGSSGTNDVVTVHEMGHYLGLYHTFEGSCTNNDCSKDGDKVCDTPPDQSTAGVGCATSVNSCATDALSGFSTDQNDLKEDYMDYGNFSCMKVFTQGQADRMNFFIQNTRKSLLNCKSCLVPCPAVVIANFNSPGTTVTAGTPVLFTNSSSNATTYEWYINNVLQSGSTNFSYAFTTVGTYTVKLLAKSPSPLCDDAVKTITINVVCGVAASFTKSASTAPCGTNINFTNTSSGATNYEWYVNGVLLGSSAAFFYTSNTGSKYEIKLVAIDNIANCRDEYKDTVEYTCAVITDFIPLTSTIKVNNPVTFTSTGTGATTYQWLINGVNVGSGTTLTYLFNTAGVFSVQLITGNGVCTSVKAAVVYVNDKCNNAVYLFQKKHTTGILSGPNNIQSTSDGGSIIAQYITPPGNSFPEGAILKLDAVGNVQWLNIYEDDAKQKRLTIAKVKQTPDGGYIAVGTSVNRDINGLYNAFVLKTTALGNVSWGKEYSINSLQSNGLDIIASTDGNYYFCGTTEAVGSVTTSRDILIGKVDASGNLLWLNTYDSRSSEIANGITEDNNQLLVCGNKSGQNGNSSFLLKLNKMDGSSVFSKTYRSTDDNFLDIMVTAGGYFVNAGQRITPGGLTTNQVYIKTDFAGNILFAKYTQPFGNTKNYGSIYSTIKPNGNIISFTGPPLFSPDQYFFVQEINLRTGVVWAKKYTRPNSWMKSLTIDNTGGLLITGNTLAPSANNTTLIRLESAGNAGTCTSESVDFEVLRTAYDVQPADFTINKPQVATYNNFSSDKAEVETTTDCDYLKCLDEPPVDPCTACRSIILNGKNSVCGLLNLFDYAVVRNDSCKLPVQWTIDASFAQIVTTTDSTIRLQFLKEGKVKLYSVITTPCKSLEDSIEIDIFNTTNSINLGPDIQLCKFSSLPLNAGAGFKTYEWNDGSSDSTFTADKPGQYVVAATDYCGNVYRDTINITLAPDVPFDLGPDLVKCTNDTLTITAPGGFSKYNWAGNYNISATAGATVKLWPAADTSYSVVAEVANGCIVLDTINIKVKKTIPINLGKDTSFCAGGSVTLQAAAGFTSFLWQDNSTNASLNATQKGTYWLQAKDINGCLSKDTLEITDLFAAPALQIGDDISICTNNNYIFSPGTSFKSYLWQDGSTASVFIASQLGKYWVQVTDNNGCVNSDTAQIIAFKPSPKDFINKAIEVCKYKPTPITAIGNWKSYNWSNGSSSSGISLTTTGTYWLEVTNAEGCKTKESFTVTNKECIKGIFFPTAFTPAKQGENNTYKPLVYADIVSYQFFVYNRFGQKIFQTTDISKGWDGTINGKPQDPNTFVWYCTYQFINEKPRAEKGSFLLLR